MGRRLGFAALAALVVLTVLPISRALVSAFVVSDVPGTPFDATLDHVRAAFAPGDGAGLARLRLLGNSVAIGLGAALLAVLLGVPFALLVERTDLPLRRIVGPAAYVPLVLPPLLIALAWNMVPFLEPPPITAAREPSPWGGVVAWARASGLFGLCLYPVVVLFARRALRRVPAALEESAALVVGRRRALLSVALPLARPGILAGALFVFVFALNDFAVVDFLNWVRPTDRQISVYPFESFVAWSKNQGPGTATALGLPLLFVGVTVLLVVHRLVGRRGHGAVRGSHRRPARVALGRWKPVATVFAVLLVAVSAVAPVLALVWKAGALGSYRGVWKLVAGSTSSTNEVAWTLWFAFAAAALAVPLAFSLGRRAARTGRAWVVALALVPLVLPPIFLGAGYLRLLNNPAIPELLGGRNPFLDADSPRYGPILLLVAKYLPFALAAMWAAFLELDPHLEEAGATAGVRPLERALSILEPLVRPASALAFVLVFVFALREIDTIVLLSSETVMRKIYTMIHFNRDDQVAALCVLLIAMQGVAFLLLAILAPRQNEAATAG